MRNLPARLLASLLKHLLPALLILLLPVSALAVDRAAAVAALVDIQRLDIDTIMMMYDESDRATNEKVRNRLKTLDGSLAPVLAEISKTDAAAGTAATEAWQKVHLALEGDSQSQGMLKVGYDARAFAEMRTGFGDLTGAVNKQYKLTGGSAEEQALLQATRVVAVYIRTAGSPFGSYSDTNDASIEEDLSQMTAKLDAMIAGLRSKYGKDPKHAAALRRISSKWGFIRGTILKYTQQSTPTIVYRHGIDMIEQLATLKP